jgi:hypothetical protein
MPDLFDQDLLIFSKQEPTDQVIRLDVLIQSSVNEHLKLPRVLVFFDSISDTLDIEVFYFL